MHCGLQLPNDIDIISSNEAYKLLFTWQLIQFWTASSRLKVTGESLKLKKRVAFESENWLASRLIARVLSTFPWWSRIDLVPGDVGGSSKHARQDISNDFAAALQTTERFSGDQGIALRFYDPLDMK